MATPSVAIIPGPERLTYAQVVERWQGIEQALREVRRVGDRQSPEVEKVDRALESIAWRYARLAMETRP